MRPRKRCSATDGADLEALARVTGRASFDAAGTTARIIQDLRIAAFMGARCWLHHGHDRQKLDAYREVEGLEGLMVCLDDRGARSTASANGHPQARRRGHRLTRKRTRREKAQDVRAGCEGPRRDQSRRGGDCHDDKDLENEVTSSSRPTRPRRVARVLPGARVRRHLRGSPRVAAGELDLALMVSDNPEAQRTAFALTVDLDRGITVESRPPTARGRSGRSPILAPSPGTSSPQPRPAAAQPPGRGARAPGTGRRQWIWPGSPGAGPPGCSPRSSPRTGTHGAASGAGGLALSHRLPMVAIAELRRHRLRADGTSARSPRRRCRRVMARSPARRGGPRSTASTTWPSS